MRRRRRRRLGNARAAARDRALWRPWAGWACLRADRAREAHSALPSTCWQTRAPDHWSERRLSAPARRRQRRSGIVLRIAPRQAQPRDRDRRGESRHGRRRGGSSARDLQERLFDQRVGTHRGAQPSFSTHRSLGAGQGAYAPARGRRTAAGRSRARSRHCRRRRLPQHAGPRMGLRRRSKAAAAAQTSIFDPVAAKSHPG